MPTEDDFTSDHSLPLFLSGHADEHEERGSLLLLNASIFVLCGVACRYGDYPIVGNPAKVFADIKASLTRHFGPTAWHRSIDANNSSSISRRGSGSSINRGRPGFAADRKGRADPRRNCCRP